MLKFAKLHTTILQFIAYSNVVNRIVILRHLLFFKLLDNSVMASGTSAQSEAIC